MEISRKDQIEFAKAMLSILETTRDIETIKRLQKLVSLLVSWVGEDNGVAILLSEYVGELSAIAYGEEDTGWRDEFKTMLDNELKNGE